MNTYGIIYVATNSVNGKQYVGQTTVSLEKRWKGHQPGNGDPGHCRALGSAILKYGARVFTLEIVDSGTNKQDLDDKETLWVAKLGSLAPNGYNLTSGGGSAGKPSRETIEKRSLALTGHPTSPETRAKIREAQLGKPFSLEHREALMVPKKNRDRKSVV